MQHHLRRLASFFFAITLLLPTSPAQANDAPNPADANWQIELVGLFGQTHDRRAKKMVPNTLALSINVHDGKVTDGVGWASRFNRAGHRVDKAELKLQPGGKFTMTVEATLFPDRWVPKDGKPIAVQGTITGAINKTNEGASLDGQYNMTVGDERKQGKITGAITARPKLDSAYLSGRLFATKIDDRDFPEMELSLGLHDGKIAWGRFGMSWNRWPHRYHMFDVSKLKFDPLTQKVTGVTTVPVRAIDVAGHAKEQLELTFDGAYIGDMFITRITTRSTMNYPATKPMTFNGGGPIMGQAGPKPRDLPEEYAWLYEVDDEPWWTPVQGHAEVKPGEHPRILFRKSEVKDIRRRAQTPEGKAIVARLRKLLGNNGEKLPTRFNNTPPHNNNKSPQLPLGTFTSFHAPGYAMLYQLTGEQKYADLAKGALELMFQGKADRDNRYYWKTPGTHLRVGTVLASVALTYDLAYDGWDEAYRKKVALELQNYSQPVASGGENATVRELMGRTGYPPASNHYGSHFGGTLLAMLAIKDDPGVDRNFVNNRIDEGQWMWPHMCAHGFGEGGWYQEGPHPSRLSTNGGFVMALQAMKNVLGRDYIAARPNGQWATLRWVMWTMPSSAGPLFINRGTYGDDRMYGRAPMYSHSGDFVFGFGAVEDKYKPAVLWTYLNNVEKPWEQGENKPWWIDKGERSFNSMVYPMHAVFALVNWPIGVEPQNPAKVMPTHQVDKVNDFFVSRNQWKDGRDIVVTFSTGGGPWGYHRPQARGSMQARAFGQEFGLPGKFGHHKPTIHRAAQDGSFTLAMNSHFFDKKRGAVAADLSGKSGAALVMIMWVEETDSKLTKQLKGYHDRLARQKAEDEHRRKRGQPVPNRPASNLTALQRGKGLFIVMTVDETQTPDVKADGNTINVGKQRYTFDGQVIGFNGLK